MKTVLFRSLAALLPLSCVLSAGASQAAEIRNVRDVQHADYTRVPGVGLLVNETMLGTMDERLGMDAEARSTERRFWIRYGAESRGSGNGELRPGAGGGRYSAGALQLGTDFYRTTTDRVGVFVGFGTGAFGKGIKVNNYNVSRPETSGYGLGLYYNHHSLAGWYVDGAIQISRLRGEYGQSGRYSSSNRWTSQSSRWEQAKATTTALALQGEVGYRLSFSSGASVTPKLRVDHHRMRLGAAKGFAAFGSTRFGNSNKTGVYYGVRLAQDWTTASGKLRVWAEPGVSHTLGARAGYTHIDFMDQHRATGRRNLNATRVGLGAGLEGDITRSQTLRLEGRFNKAVGKRGGSGRAIMASWNYRF